VNILDAKKVDDQVDSILRLHYDNSLIKALFANYPDHDWKVWKFDYSYKGLFNDGDESSLNKMIEKATEEMIGAPVAEDFMTTIQRSKDFWQIRLFSPSKMDSLASDYAPYCRPKQEQSVNTIEDIDEFAFKPTLASLSSTSSSSSLLNSTLKSPPLLIDTVKEMFPNEEIRFSFEREDLIYSDTKRPFKLDIYLPRLSIAFEYLEDPNSGAQYAMGAHYSIYHFFKAKRIVCESRNITLVEVPSYWDRKKSSLISVVKRLRPEIFQEKSTNTPTPASTSNFSSSSQSKSQSQSKSPSQSRKIVEVQIQSEKPTNEEVAIKVENNQSKSVTQS